MSVEKSLDTILGPVRRFNLSGIWIRDDEFHISRERAYQICEGIVKSGSKISWYTSGARVDIFNSFSDEQTAMLKRSGAHTLKFGAESGSDRILRLISKGITVEDIIKSNLKAKRFGIIPCYSFMMGFPTESFEEIHQTINLAIRLKRDNPQAQLEGLSPYTPLPGTPLYGMAMTFGLKPPEGLIGWSRWNFEETKSKLLWFKSGDRQKIHNLSYMWLLSNAVQNTVDGIHSPFLRFLVKIFSIPAGLYFWLRVRKKSYSFVPELVLFKCLHALLLKARITFK